MATFPTLTPNSRTYSPGEYPHSAFAGMSGVQNRVRNSNVMLSSQLRLTFTAITESQMLSILAHYQGQQGTFLSFPIPSAIWNAVSSVNDYQLAGYGWRYIEPPSVTDSMCANAYDVELTLETVPPEGTAAAGLDFLVRTTLTAGAATATFDFSVAVLLAAGSATAGATVNGLDENVSMTLAAGAATGGSGGGDPDFANVSLLLHMDGSNGSTTFTDSGPLALGIVRYGDTIISTAQSKFGGASAYFDGTGDYLRQETNTTAFDFSSGAFTVEVWTYQLSAKNAHVVGMRTADWRIELRSDQSIQWASAGLVRFTTATSVAPLNQWNHIAACSDGTTTTLYVNGSSVGTTTSNPAVGSGDHLSVGRNPATTARDFNGYMDELRITKGVARYTANFTPPTAPFPDS